MAVPLKGCALRAIGAGFLTDGRWIPGAPEAARPREQMWGV